MRGRGSEGRSRRHRQTDSQRQTDRRREREGAMNRGLRGHSPEPLMRLMNRAETCGSRVPPPAHPPPTLTLILLSSLPTPSRSFSSLPMSSLLFSSLPSPVLSSPCFSSLFPFSSLLWLFLLYPFLPFSFCLPHFPFLSFSPPFISFS